MAEPTESRTNKAFIIPEDLERPAIDPAATDASYDKVEAIRAARTTAGEEQTVDTSYDAVEATRAARTTAGQEQTADTSYDAVEAMRAARGADADAESHAEKSADLQSAMDAHDVPDSVDVVNDITPGNYP